MGKQLKYADRRNAPCVIIQGSDEKARGEIQIKDLILGAEALPTIKDREAVFARSRPRRSTRCDQDELVDEVREVLARHEVKWG